MNTLIVATLISAGSFNLTANVEKLHEKNDQGVAKCIYQLESQGMKASEAAKKCYYGEKQ